MTSTNTLSAEKYSSRKYFSYKFRSNWNILLAFIIIICISMIIPCLLSTGTTMNWMRENKDILSDKNFIGSLKNSIESTLRGLSISGIFVSGFTAIFAGMSALSYVNDKKSTGCYHSFPLTRGTIYLTETSVYAIYYMVAVTLGYGLSYLIMSCTLPYTAEFASEYFSFMAAGVALFFVAYTTFLFIGGLTGTNVVKFILTAVYLVLGAALFALFILMLLVGCTDLSMDYYFSSKVFMYICSAYRYAQMVLSIGNGGPVLKLLWLVPEIVLCYIGGYFLHKYRKSERSGNTIVWKPVFYITKYVVMFMAALGGVLIFGFASEFISARVEYTCWGRNIRMLIGALIFSFLTYMIVNAILYRSTKSIFKDIKGFFIFYAITAVFVLLVPCNVTGLIGKIAPYERTSKLEVEYNGEYIEIEDEKVARAVIEAMESGWNDYYREIINSDDNKMVVPERLKGATDGVDDVIEKYFGDYLDGKYYDRYEDYVTVDEDDYYQYDENTLNVIEQFKGIESYRSVCFEAVQHRRFGIPWAMSLTVPLKTVAAPLSRTPEFEKYLNEKVDNGDPDQFFKYYSNYESFYLSRDFWSAFDDNYKSFADVYEYSVESRNEYPLIGFIREYNSSLPVYADNIDVINFIDELKDNVENMEADYNSIHPSSVEDVYDEFCKETNYALLVKADTGESVVLGKKEIKSLLPMTAALCDISELNSEEKMFADYSDVNYVIVIADYDKEVNIIYFRDGAVTEEYLDGMFERHLG